MASSSGTIKATLTKEGLTKLDPETLIHDQWEGNGNLMKTYGYEPTNDVFLNSVNLQNSPGERINEIPKIHRTAVIIYGSSASSDEFRERVYRLCGCFNTAGTIKTSIVTLSGSKMYIGANFQNDTKDDDGFLVSPEHLKEMKKNFVQVLEIKESDSE